MSEPVASVIPASLTDEELVLRILDGETALFELIMRRNNARLYRVTRGIVRDDSEAEDVMQESYVRAYEHLNQFAGRAKFSTWLTRIAVHEALARLKQRKRFQENEPVMDSHSADHEPAGDRLEQMPAAAPSPERQAASAELGKLLESAMESLPADYRTALVLRDVEEFTTAEAAECLEISEENVKVRLHRARAMMRQRITAELGEAGRSVYQFHAPRCDRVVAQVLARIGS